MITIENIHEHTQEEVFVYLTRHLLTQRKKSGDFSGTKSIVKMVCKYRKGALRCAAGILIPDHIYVEDFEGVYWHGLTERLEAYYPHCRTHSDLVAFFQLIHDCHEVFEWPYEIMRLAKVFSIPLPAEFTELRDWAPCAKESEK